MTAPNDQLSAALKPSNDMIVLPFHAYQRYHYGMIAVRAGDDDFMLVSPLCYDPKHYPPGSCIQ